MEGCSCEGAKVDPELDGMPAPGVAARASGLVDGTESFAPLDWATLTSPMSESTFMERGKGVAILEKGLSFGIVSGIKDE